MKCVVCVLCMILFIQTSYAFDKNDAIVKSGNTITIIGDRGGNFKEYEKLLKKIKRDKTEIRLKRYCASSCTIFLSLPYDQVCVYPEIELVFHNPRYLYNHKIVEKKYRHLYMEKYYPQWVKDYLAKLGGIPGSAKRLMTYSYAKKYVRTC